MQLSFPILVVLALACMFAGMYIGIKVRSAMTRSGYPPPSYDQPNLLNRPHSRRSSGCLVPFFLLVALLLAGWFVLYSGSFSLTLPKNLTGLQQSISAPFIAATCSPGKVTCSPTINAAFIDRVLKAAGSSAQGLGTTLMTLGTQYQIDPAYALAFFHHESTYGLYGVARVTHSLGNIECTPGWTCVDDFRSYKTWADGAADWFKVIHTVYVTQGLDTIQKIIPKYAPPKNNNNPASIQAVLDDIARWQKGQV